MTRQLANKHLENIDEIEKKYARWSDDLKGYLDNFRRLFRETIKDE